MNKTKNLWILVVAILALTVSACGGADEAPTPTPVDPNLIAAQAIATFSMGLTQTAFANPTATFTLTPVPTNTFAPTFAPLGTNTSGPVPTSGCYVIAFVLDVTITDGTVMEPGQNFDKTWRLKNAGTCPWTATFKAEFTGSGNGALGGVSTPIGKVVNPGETIDITVEFVAPANADNYVSWWKLKDDTGSWLFGDGFSVAIKVAEPTVDATATAAAAGTATAIAAETEDPQE